jgi:hypothetical protein
VIRARRAQLCAPASFAEYDRWRNIIDRPRHGAATAIQDRTTRYLAFRRGAPSSRTRASLNLLTGAIAVAISGCVGPPVLERQVLGYDEVTKALDEKLLLLNIARVSNQEPVHFTSTSSIAATFNWTATLGANGQVTGSKGTNFLNLNIGGARRRIRRSASLPFRERNLPSELQRPFRTRSSSSSCFKGARSTRPCV